MSKHVNIISKIVKIRQSNSYIPPIKLVDGGRVLLEKWVVPMRGLRHWHIYWNLNPGGRLILPDKEIQMTPEMVYLLPPYLMFATESVSAFEHLYLDFCLESEPFSRLKKEPVLFQSRDYLWLLEKCFQEPFSSLTAGALILALLSDIPPENFAPEGMKLMDSRIQNALDLISSSFQAGQFKALSNKTLGRRLGMSTVNFQHLFKHELKISPHRYILNLRLAQAYELLKNSRRTIEEIADMTGFANRYQFTKSFTRLYKISPGQFRKK